MSIREQIAKYQKVSGAVAVVAALGAITYMVRSATEASPSTHLANTYFSNDDGASYFADEGGRAIALERGDRPAYLAAVYSCDGEGGHRFVAYLTRQPAADLDALDKARANADAVRAKYAFNDIHVANAEDAVSAKQKTANAHSEVKRPGAANHWVAMASPQGRDIVDHIQCPGGTGTPQVVLP